MALPIVAQHVCLTCSTLQKTCCTNGYQVPLTIADVERIFRLGHPLASFAWAAPYTDADIADEEPWFGGTMLQSDGARYHLGVKHHESGHCVFLKDGVGCTLGSERPTVCKMYPFWSDLNNVVQYDSDELTFCHMAKIGTGVKEGLAMLGESEESVRTYMAAFRQDGIENAARHHAIVRALLSGSVPEDFVEEGRESRDARDHAHEERKDRRGRE